jgi:hypothetical protein
MRETEHITWGELIASVLLGSWIGFVFHGDIYQDIIVGGLVTGLLVTNCRVLRLYEERK